MRWRFKRMRSMLALLEGLYFFFPRVVSSVKRQLGLAHIPKVEAETRRAGVTCTKSHGGARVSRQGRGPQRPWSLRRTT